MGSPTLDIHVHLLGVGDAGSGCRLVLTGAKRLLFRFLARKLRLRGRAGSLDEAYVLALAEHFQGSGLDKAVVLAQDAIYGRDGRLDWARTSFYVPNDYLFQVAARYRQWMIPCVSVNPQRADALAELDRCAAKGAKLLKIHPPIQGVDLADKKHTAFFRRCAALKMIVLVHTGHEHSAPVVDVRLADPQKLALALAEGCTVVACHCGSGWWRDRPDMLPDFLRMLRQHENLWGDTSILGSAGPGARLSPSARRPRGPGTAPPRQRLSVSRVPPGLCRRRGRAKGDQAATDAELDAAGPCPEGRPRHRPPERRAGSSPDRWGRSASDCLISP